MIEYLLKELLDMNVSNEDFDEKYYILLKNVSQMSSEQLQKLKQIVLKKLEYDSGIYERESERIR